MSNKTGDTARVVAQALGVPFGLSVLSFLGATAQTIGVVAFFAFEVLYPYRWWLLLGGTAAIAVAELLKYLWAKSVTREDDVEDLDV